MLEVYICIKKWASIPLAPCISGYQSGLPYPIEDLAPTLELRKSEVEIKGFKFFKVVDILKSIFLLT
jgi:hypothetical protein